MLVLFINMPKKYDQVWLDLRLPKRTESTQKPCCFLKQFRRQNKFNAEDNFTWFYLLLSSSLPYSISIVVSSLLGTCSFLILGTDSNPLCLVSSISSIISLKLLFS